MGAPTCQLLPIAAPGRGLCFHGNSPAMRHACHRCGFNTAACQHRCKAPPPPRPPPPAACSGGLAPGSRRGAAVRVRLGEKEALDATLRYFEDRIGRWAVWV